MASSQQPKKILQNNFKSISRPSHQRSNIYRNFGLANLVFKEDFGQASERAFKEQIIKQTFPQINKHGNSNNIPWRIQERQRVGGIAYLIRGNPSQYLPSRMGISVHAVQKM